MSSADGIQKSQRGVIAAHEEVLAVINNGARGCVTKGARAPAEIWLLLEQANAATALSQRDSGRESRQAAADDQNVFRHKPSGASLKGSGPLHSTRQFCTACRRVRREGAPGLKVEPDKIERFQFGPAAKDVVLNGLNPLQDGCPREPRQAKLPPKLRNNAFGQRLAVGEQLPGPFGFKRHHAAPSFLEPRIRLRAVFKLPSLEDVH